jgi:hypothetical protein
MNLNLNSPARRRPPGLDDQLELPVTVTRPRAGGTVRVQHQRAVTGTDQAGKPGDRDSECRAAIPETGQPAAAVTSHGDRRGSQWFRPGRTSIQA